MPLGGSECRHEIAVAFGRRIVNDAAARRWPANACDSKKMTLRSVLNHRHLPAALLALLVLTHFEMNPLKLFDHTVEGFPQPAFERGRLDP